jgi:KipI family sensor histidine kinase inhibitor
MARQLPYGDRAVLVELDGPPTQMHRLRDQLAGLVGIAEVVPAARTVLVRFDPALIAAADLTAAIEMALARPRVDDEPHGPVVTLPVHYDGPDLRDVAEQIGCSVAEVIELHTGGQYTVAFCGFAPGFAYLTGLDPRLQLPRRATPRTTVPTGAVGVAGEFTAAYPRPSPGGWQLIGRTEAPLWDLHRAEPALLMPGARVRFEVAP